MSGRAAREPSGFRDQFSSVAEQYVRFRPTYPDELFDWLAELAPDRALAWDCATGSGQAAAGLARRFDRVVATDASPAQLANAPPHPRVEYRRAPAEASGLPEGSASLITVAQALHWIELEPFWREVRRVGREGGIIAVWCYSGLEIEPAVDAVIGRFYRETVGPFWAPERRFVDTGYRTLPFPFAELPAPRFTMATDWTLGHLEGYLRSWSATANYRAALGEDPVPGLHPSLAAAWGDPSRARVVRWPLHLRAGRVTRETAPDRTA